MSNRITRNKAGIPYGTDFLQQLEDDLCELSVQTREYSLPEARKLKDAAAVVAFIRLSNELGETP